MCFRVLSFPVSPFFCSVQSAQCGVSVVTIPTLSSERIYMGWEWEGVKADLDRVLDRERVVAESASLSGRGIMRTMHCIED